MTYEPMTTSGLAICREMLEKGQTVFDSATVGHLLATIESNEFDIERLAKSVADAHRSIEELEAAAYESRLTLCYLYKWVERGMFDKTHGPKTAIEVLAYHPAAPWSFMRWDVDHKPYANAFYGTFPRAKED